MIANNIEELKKIKNNKIIIEDDLELIDSFIDFKGENNILICDKKVKIENSRIVFHGNNSIVYLSSNFNNYKLNVSIYNNNTLYIGKNNYFNESMTIILSEERNVFIGDECLFSTGIVFRTADPHLIFDVKSHQRINYSKSIYIGDHVWIGQNTLVLKGTKIDSGSIIGAMSLVSGKKVEHNTTNAGIPLRMIKKKIFWTSTCVHKWTSKDTKENKEYESSKYIYHYDEKNSIEFQQIEEELGSNSIDKKLEYLKKISKNNHKNRFVHLIGHVRLKKFIIKLKKIIKK